MIDKLELKITRTIPANRKKVFRAWLEPKALAQFMCPGEGMSVPKVEVDPHVGGEFLIVMKAGEKELPHSGSYRTIKEHSELSFTWHSAFSGPDSLVTLRFEELGPEQTRLTLHHVGFPSEESRTNHEGGWKQIVELLGKLAPGFSD